MSNREPYDGNRVVKLEPKLNGRNYAGDKETVGTWIFVAPLPRDHWSGRKIGTAVTVRAYMGRSRNASTVYASVWAKSRDGSIDLAGHGSASGYGKVNAAVEDAFESAGITMSAHFGGCGDSSIEHAIEALARKLGWKAGNVLRP